MASAGAAPPPPASLGPTEVTRSEQGEGAAPAAPPEEPAAPSSPPPALCDAPKAAPPAPQGAAPAASSGDPTPVLQGPPWSSDTLLWIATPVVHRNAVAVRSTLASRVEVLESWSSEEDKKESRLLRVRVHWREPLAGRSTFDLALGHLHNKVATRGGARRAEFFDELAAHCARGARLLGLDANMAAWGVCTCLAQRGVEATLVASHFELGREGEPLFDTLGIWAIGPLPAGRCKIVTPACHALAGAHHPSLLDGRAESNIHRGYAPKHHRFPTPDHLGLQENADLPEACEEIRTRRGILPAEEHPEIAGETSAPADVLRSPRPDIALFRQQVAREPVQGLSLPCPQHPAGYYRTQSFEPLPAVQEILAESDSWDPWGARWGRDAHWPLLLSVGLRRYRSKEMKQRRHIKKRNRAAAKLASGESPQPLSKGARQGGRTGGKGKGKAAGKGGGGAKTGPCASGAPAPPPPPPPPPAP